MDPFTTSLLGSWRTWRISSFFQVFFIGEPILPDKCEITLKKGIESLFMEMVLYLAKNL